MGEVVAKKGAGRGHTRPEKDRQKEKGKGTETHTRCQMAEFVSFALWLFSSLSPTGGLSPLSNLSLSFFISLLERRQEIIASHYFHGRLQQKSALCVLLNASPTLNGTLCGLSLISLSPHRQSLGLFSRGGRKKTKGVDWMWVD